ncbi:hypothetical protein K3495_g12091 [Podosphaera aphanis]|nr:hypothetical protein K3495_g12091 [Podosphaera aphanis]
MLHGTAATSFKALHGITSCPVTLSRPRGNGKVEQANGVLKDALARSTVIYNRRVGPSGYSPYFLLFGTQPPGQQMTFAAYTRDPTPGEDQAWAQELALQHAAPIARSYVASAKAIRAKVRSYLQEKKGLTRVYAPGDWVLRVRQRTNKFEPYYDGPWAIAACHLGNTYSLISPGGFPMANKYNGSNLFPAYVRDGHPVRSLCSGLSPFFLKHGYHAEPITLKTSKHNFNKTAPTKLAEKFIGRIYEAQEYAAAAMASAQQLMEERTNLKRNPAPIFRVGDKVWLNLRNIKTPQPKKKLAWVNAKYRVTKIISPHVVELDVPSKIFPRFHVELLRKASEDPLPSQSQDGSLPEPVMVENDQGEAEPEHLVERILRAERIRRGG